MHLIKHTSRRLLIASFLAVTCGIRPAGAGFTGGLPGEFLYSIDSPRTEYRLLNPAWHGLADRQEASFTDNMLPGGNHLMGLVYSRPLSPSGTFGSGISFLSEGRIEARDMYDRPLGRFFQAKYMVSVAYAHRFLRHGQAGIAFKATGNQSAVPGDAGDLASILAVGSGFDLGLHWQVKNRYSAGISLQNLGYAKTGGDARAYDPWPVNLQMELGYYVLQERLRFRINTNIFDISSGPEVFAGGNKHIVKKIEYAALFKVLPRFSCIASYDIKSWYLGLEYQWKKRADVEYAAGYNYRGQNFLNRLGMTAGWGTDRPAAVRRTKDDQKKQTGEKEFKRAMELYTKGRYYEAALAFGKNLPLFKETGRADAALRYFGESCYNLQLYRSARTAFLDLEKQYPRSAQVQLALTHRFLIACHLKQHTAALEIYRTLQKRFPRLSGIGAVHYQAGQLLMKRGSYSDAIAAFGSIPDGDPLYGYARYSWAQCCLYTENADSALINLEKVRAGAPAGGMAAHLAHKALLTQGYLLFELHRFREAVETFDRIPETSVFHAGSRLGKAWCLFRQSAYDDALAALEKAGSRAPQDIKTEAAVLKSYIHILQKKYGPAVKVLGLAVDEGKAFLKTASGTTADQAVTRHDTGLRRQEKSLTELDARLTRALLKSDPGKTDLTGIAAMGTAVEKYNAAAGQLHAVLAGLATRRNIAGRLRSLLPEAEYTLLLASHMESVQKKREKDAWYDNMLMRKNRELWDKLKSIPRTEKTPDK